MRSRYWSADVCASDLSLAQGAERRAVPVTGTGLRIAAAVPAPVTSPFGLGVLGSFIAALVLLLLGYILWRLPSRIGGAQHADDGTAPTLSQVLVDGPPPANEPAPVAGGDGPKDAPGRSEEHTAELPALMRRSYAVLC